MLVIAKRVSIGFLLIVFIMYLLSACGGSTSSNTPSSILNVVAAENFYGDIVKQIGGDRVAVTSILSDPNVDPHAYESNVQNGVAVTKAQFVIANGGGYDDWMDKLLSASPDSNRVVLKGFDIAKNKLPDNEHVWYGLDNIQTIAQSITDALKKLDVAHATTFESNLQKFKQSLLPILQKVASLKAKYGGTPIGLTETIFLYQAEPLALKVLTPFTFQKAIAEGNDPPADTVVTVNSQVSQHQIKVLVYNEQTVTPITTKLENDARKLNIPIVPVSETMPQGKNYQQWMLDQLTTLEQALQQNK